MYGHIWGRSFKNGIIRVVGGFCLICRRAFNISIIGCVYTHNRNTFVFVKNLICFVWKLWVLEIRKHGVFGSSLAVEIACWTIDSRCWFGFGSLLWSSYAIFFLSYFNYDNNNNNNPLPSHNGPTITLSLWCDLVTNRWEFFVLLIFIGGSFCRFWHYSTWKYITRK